jgi:hypothetical protein
MVNLLEGFEKHFCPMRLRYQVIQDGLKKWNYESNRKLSLPFMRLKSDNILV